MALMLDRAEPAGRLGRGDGGETPLAAVEIDDCCDVDVSDAVAISQAKLAIFAE